MLTNAYNMQWMYRIITQFFISRPISMVNIYISAKLAKTTLIQKL
jgi:hypothetical protein